MEVDVEIALPDLAASLANYGLGGLLPEGYFVEHRGNREVSLFIRGYDSSGTKINETIFRFLSGLQPLEGNLRELKAELRVGVFYDIRETVVFPLYINIGTIDKMSLFGLSLDANIYVCNGE